MNCIELLFIKGYIGAQKGKGIEEKSSYGYSSGPHKRPYPY